LSLDNINDVKKFIGKGGENIEYYYNETDFLKHRNVAGLHIETRKGRVVAKIDDFIFRDATGSFIAMSEVDFFKCYREIDYDKSGSI